jgi:serine protease Do
MSRTRDWLKFGGLVSVTLAVAVVLIAALGQPTRAAERLPFLGQTPAHEVIPAQQPAPLPRAAQPLADLSSAFTAVADLIKPAVVFVESDKYPSRDPHRGIRVPPGMEEFFPQAVPRLQRGTGSGFIISHDGYIMTNNHVVEGADKVKVRLLDKRQFDATVVGRDPQTDVAIIKIDADNLPVASFGDSDSLRVGEWVLAVGNPLGEAFSFTVTAGIVSAKGRGLAGLPNAGSYSIMDFIQTDAAINPGNSGGPLVNIRGQVIGINSAIASENGYYQGYGFAIPTNLARTVGNQLISDGRVRRSILGVSIRDATEDDAAYVGLDSVRGVVVQDYSLENGPAEKAGIEVGDLILELDGEPVSYVAQLQQLVGFKKPGSTVRVTIMGKDRARRTVSVRLIEAPPDEQVATADQEEPTDSAQPAGSRSALGIVVEQPPTEVARRLGNDHTGPVVTDVELDSPARDRIYPPSGGAVDIITYVNGTRVRTLDDFENAMKAARPGTVVSLRVYTTANGGLSGSRVVRVRVPK